MLYFYSRPVEEKEGFLGMEKHIWNAAMDFWKSKNIVRNLCYVNFIYCTLCAYNPLLNFMYFNRRVVNMIWYPTPWKCTLCLRDTLGTIATLWVKRGILLGVALYSFLLESSANQKPAKRRATVWCLASHSVWIFSF